MNSSPTCCIVAIRAVLSPSFRRVPAPFEMRILTAVSPTGTKLRFFTYLCGTGRPPATVFGIPIDATGHFKWANEAKGWKMAGHFVTATKAFVSLNSIACGGSKGSTTLTLK